jgi:hypothetical protein
MSADPEAATFSTFPEMLQFVPEVPVCPELEMVKCCADKPNEQATAATISHNLLNSILFLKKIRPNIINNIKLQKKINFSLIISLVVPEVIAKEVGFYTYNSFYTAFKEVTGNAPQKYVTAIAT